MPRVRLVIIRFTPIHFGSCGRLFPSPELWIEGRSGEHPGSRQSCTQYIARDSNQQNYHRELLDRPRCTKFVFKSAKSGVKITAVQDESAQHATMFLSSFNSTPSGDAKSSAAEDQVRTSALMLLV